MVYIKMEDYTKCCSLFKTTFPDIIEGTDVYVKGY